MPEIVVLGGGVSGLTSALSLLRAGFRQVQVCALHFGAATTSHGAGALWERPPYHVEPAEACLRWTDASLAHFQRLADVPDSGVVRRQVVGLGGSPPLPETRAVAGFRELSARELAAACPELAADAATDAFVYDSYVACMPEYLKYLAREVMRAGGELVELDEPVCDAALELGRPGRVVVNCAGLRGGAAAGDGDEAACYPVRGQLVLVRCPEVRRVIDAGATYLIPREGGVVVCGGTLEAGEWDEEPSEAAAADILRRCARLCPAVADAPVLAHWAGLRPARRGGVRLERRGRVVHNYGHGGSGVTLSWGAAEEVVRLVGSMVSPDSPGGSRL